MGWTILYIAFALVALWLLGEVLFQNKAPLRWRLLALGGFLGVVTGVLLPSVVVIALGAVAFAIGQTYVTLSVRRGYTEGWTIGGRPKPNRRRRARPSRGAAAGPNLQVSGLTEETPPDAAGSGTEPAAGDHGNHGDDGIGTGGPYAPQQDPAAPGEPPAAAPDFGYAYAYADAPTVYAPQPMPDETGTYGVYSPDARPDQPGDASYDLFGNVTAEGEGHGYGEANGHAYGGGYGQPAGQPTGQPAGQDGYADPYPAYDDGSYHHGAQAPYSDPYIGAQQYAAHYEPYEEPDPFGRPPYQPDAYDAFGGQPGHQDEQSQHGQHAQPYGQEQYPQPPPDGVWVPQQRDTGHHPAEQPSYPPQQPGYGEQYYHY
ncbi:hypothetical protein K2224_26150 [Streptomyces sp. BHT-5-2]|uniref:hypothetical protein n=1 Tax=Streptomyces sp. BHT-5-2 TaxID=2866715 RepID=UPI001C8EFD08|nr:hypothetical protein [Streptomyces sp. BHT-5-2]QZL06222.1 hypothetical protein K2224_26150 [Streptomyces sp. BHT-5-2]